MNSEETKRRLAANLSAALKFDSLSYWELAKRVDVSDQIISNICRGEHEPRVSVLTELAGALGLDWQVMLSDSDDFLRELRRRGRETRVQQWVDSRSEAVA